LYLNALTRMMVKRLVAGEIDKPHYPLRHQFLSWLLRIEWIAPAVNSWFTYTKKKKCIHCNLCLKNCPNQAIYLNKKGRIKINNNCSLCMRCVMNCPVDAFHFGFLNNWKVVGGFNYPKLLADASIPNYHVYWGVKDYFRHFQKYFDEQDAFLKKYGLPLPVEYPSKPQGK
jgi:ferredoxin